MDGRWKPLLVGGLLCGLMGCGHLRDRNKSRPPGDTGEPPLNISRQDEKKGPVGAPTYVAFANLKVSASLDENRGPAERDDLQNQARVAYEHALKGDPKHVPAMLGMMKLYALMKDKAKCAEWYEKAAKAQPSNAALHQDAGKILAKDFKDLDGAIRAFHQATKLDPENREYRKTLGFSLAQAGRYEEAYAWLSKAFPTEAEARYNLAGIMQHTGNHDQARQQLAMAIQAEPNHAKAKQAMVYYSGGQPRPSDEALRSVNYENVTPPPALNVNGVEVPVPPAAPRPPAGMPGAGPKAPKAPAAPLMTTSGWDR